MISRFGELRLLQLSLRNVGPFRERIRRFEFMGTLGKDAEGKPRGDAPANLYMLFAMNGKGKTTILRAIHRLMAMTGSGDEEGLDTSLFSQDASAQLDLRLTLTVDGDTRTTLLSIWYGTEGPLVEWTNQEVDEKADASEWAKLGFTAQTGERVLSPESDNLGRNIREHIRYGIGEHPTQLYGLSTGLPSVLFFPANRMVWPSVGERMVVCPNGWGYQPAQMFESDGPTWASSIDSALVWLEWLDDGRLDELLSFVNRNLFRDGKKSIQRPRRDTLSAVVSTSNGDHALSELSHGERALLQLYVRTLCHMTENSVLLIDEIENHLHTRWMNLFFSALKTLIREVPSLSVVFTTHNRELMRVFDHTRPETGIVKGGYLIEDGIE